jgi:hypothetical protein
MRYRKRKAALDIEALEWDGSDACARKIAEWSGGIVKETIVNRLAVATPEGELLSPPGHYIVKQEPGVFYPCAPEVFHNIYEPTT